MKFERENAIIIFMEIQNDRTLERQKRQQIQS